MRSQAAGQWRVGTRSRISSEEFYLYQLYLPERRAAADTFLPRKRTLSLLAKLHRLTRPDLDSLRDKRVFARRCAEAGLPTPPIIAQFDGGARVDGAPLGAGPVDLFAKPASRWGGLGALAWRFAGRGSYVDAEGRPWTGGEVEAELERRSETEPLVVQERLSNHAALAPLTNGALCSARLLTCRRPDGGFDCVLPTFRLPWGSAIVDNFARGGIKAPLDLESGEITGSGVRLDEGCGVRVVERHPDTGEAFGGFRLPDWDAAVDLAMQAARAFEEVPFVGWDVAFVEDGPILLEGNVDWNADATQLPHGRGLGDTPFVAYYLHQLGRAQAAASRPRRP